MHPAAEVLERGRQVPVEDRQHRRDAGLEQAVQEPVVEAEPGLVHRARACREHPTPRDREPIRAEPERVHERDILAPASVVIAGDVAGRAAPGATGRVRKPVPVAGPGAVSERRALDLIGGSRCAPQESGGEFAFLVQSGLPLSRGAERVEARSRENSCRNVTHFLTLPQRGCNRLHGNETTGPTPPPGWTIRRASQELARRVPGRARDRPGPSIAAASTRRRPAGRWLLLTAASGEPAPLLNFGRHTS